jgi:hypothetical protein
VWRTTSEEWPPALEAGFWFAGASLVPSLFPPVIPKIVPNAGHECTLYTREIQSMRVKESRKSDAAYGTIFRISSVFKEAIRNFTFNFQFNNPR